MTRTNRSQSLNVFIFGVSLNFCGSYLSCWWPLCFVVPGCQRLNQEPLVSRGCKSAPKFAGGNDKKGNEHVQCLAVCIASETCVWNVCTHVASSALGLKSFCCVVLLQLLQDYIRSDKAASLFPKLEMCKDHQRPSKTIKDQTLSSCADGLHRGPLACFWDEFTILHFLFARKLTRWSALTDYWTKQFRTDVDRPIQVILNCLRQWRASQCRTCLRRGGSCPVAWWWLLITYILHPFHCLSPFATLVLRRKSFGTCKQSCAEDWFQAGDPYLKSDKSAFRWPIFLMRWILRGKAWFTLSGQVPVRRTPFSFQNPPEFFRSASAWLAWQVIYLYIYIYSFGLLWWRSAAKFVIYRPIGQYWVVSRQPIYRRRLVFRSLRHNSAEATCPWQTSKPCSAVTRISVAKGHSKAASACLFSLFAAACRWQVSAKLVAFLW